MCVFVLILMFRRLADQLHLGGGVNIVLSSVITGKVRLIGIFSVTFTTSSF